MSDNLAGLGGIARRLVLDGVGPAEVMRQAITEIEQQKEKVSVVHYLCTNKLAKPYDLASAISNEFGDPFLDLNAVDSRSFPSDLVDEKIITQFKVMPIFVRGKRLFVAMSDPTMLEPIDAIRFNTKLNIEIVIVEFDKLNAAIESKYNAIGGAIGGDDSGLDLEFGTDDEGAVTEESTSAEDEAPIVKYINKMLLDAIRMGASDLHFEPYEKSYRVRFRVDGVMREMSNPPIKLANRMAARLKVMSQMDISERRIPQDGRIKLKVSKTKSIDFRVNSLPTLFGEKLVLRILDASVAMMGIDALGYEPDQKALFMSALEKPQGLLLITGPTGSGKTVSLYTGLNILNQPDINISTAEDPVEINLEGVNQVNVNNKVGLSFPVALKSFLRQDPDVIMVGEIRDLETAEIAVKAAQTGHMVLSTLHTNSAPETLTRLRNMGIPSFNIATSINLVIAQRLARKLCAQCKTEVDVPPNSLLEMGFTEADLATGFKLFAPVGCSQCRDGYKGRVGVYEVMKVVPEIARIIMEEGNSIEIAEASQRAGFNNLRRSGLMKVMQGLTSLQEIDRITS
ncbi:unnamed protein product [Rotaria magnacalcarata]|uniref:Bacterial type II secretion system protein E domain-containing protein n=2 Tax=Rotaria magnacalcarata TaxID=392030 RepID=A0A820K3U1_9BILA|nr:unnamed protein product [Rotaria magnacalcarata]